MDAVSFETFCDVSRLEAAGGTAGGEIFRIAEATFYQWKKVYAAMGVSEIQRLKQLEDENEKLKRLVADLTSWRRECPPQAF